MKTKTLVLTIFLLLIAFLFLSGCGTSVGKAYSSTNGTCVDSDGGNNTGVFGTIKFDYLNGTSKPSGRDNCGVDNVHLSEVICDNTGNEITLSYVCPHGCANGACVQGTLGTCVDSDGGNNSNVNGSILLNNTVLLKDSCEGSRLIEQTCDNGYGIAKLITCPNGCANGVCNATPTCPELTRLEVCGSKTCGSIKLNNGCVNLTYNCGSCLTGQTCIASKLNNTMNNTCCTAKTKLQLCGTRTCGTVGNDGCGKAISCGSCNSTQVCSSLGSCCVAQTCTQMGKACGTVTNNCGLKVNCGICATGRTCVSGCCALTKTTACGTKVCGTVSNGCGGTISCGTCAVGKECNPSGVCVSVFG